MARRILPILLLLALGACAGTAEPVTEAPRVVVAREEQRLQLSVAPSGAVRAAFGDLGSFVALWRDQGWGPLMVEVPALPDAARQRLRAELAGRARRLGADPDAIAFAGTGGPGVWLRFDRAVALLPACGPEAVGIGHSLDGPGTSLGCATRRNLGAMVANPADLVDPRFDGAANATRGAVVVDTHRKGPPPDRSAGSGAGSGADASPFGSR